MEAFRDLIRGWLGKALLVLLLVPFALVGIESYFVRGHAAPAATVNGTDIPMTKLDKALEKQKQEILSGMGPGADASRIDMAVLRSEILRNLVDEELLRQDAAKSGFLVSDAMISRMISEEPAFQENGKFSPSRFAQVLRSVGEDPATFPVQAKERIAQRQLMSGIIATGFTSLNEMNLVTRLNNQKRDIHVLTIPAMHFVGMVQATDAEVAAEYKQHPDRYTSEEKVTAEYVALSPERFQSTVTITQDDLDQRYAEKLKALESNEQRHASHILIKVDDKTKDADARAKIQAIEKRVKAGEDFGKLAKELSQDPGSAANNGDLGMAGHGMFVPEFEKALFALKTGEVSAPVKTQFGYHLIKLLDVQKAAVPTLADMRAELETEVRQIKAEDAFNEAIEKLDATAYESSDLKDIAKAYQLPVEVTTPFTLKGGEGVAANRKFVQTAFSDDLLKDGKNSAGLRLEDKRVVWLRVKSHDKAALKPLADVTGMIRLRLQLEKASAMARTHAENAAKALAAGKSPAEIAAAEQLQWVDFAAVTRSAQTPSADIQKVAFRLPAPKAGSWSADAKPLGKDFAVIAVSAVTEDLTPLAPEQRQQLAQAQGTMRGQQELMDYVEYLRSKAKIEIIKPEKN